MCYYYFCKLNTKHGTYVRIPAAGGLLLDVWTARMVIRIVVVIVGSIAGTVGCGRCGWAGIIVSVLCTNKMQLFGYYIIQRRIIRISNLP